jgi:hypothetical protein
VNTYSIKIALRGISPMIWRRLRIDGNTSIAGLHYIIQIAMGVKPRKPQNVALIAVSHGWQGL